MFRKRTKDVFWKRGTLSYDPPAMRQLTVICSVYNEEQTIPLFYARMRQVFRALDSRYRTCLYFVDNGCTDRSLELIRAIAAEDPDVYCWVLSRNFGYQCAIESGLRNSPGDLFVVIDVDCEDPPEMILEFLEHHEQGYDIVYGERVDRPESRWLKAGRKLFYRSIRRVADDNFVLDMAEFALITAEVRDAIVQDNNSFPFVRSSIGRIGFKRKNLPYTRHSRIAGVTHYNIFGLLFFATAGILSSSTFPLRVATYAFPFWVAAMAGLAAAASIWEQAWATPWLAMLGFTYCGFTLAAIGLYVARIYKNGLNRPNVIVRPGLSILPAGIVATSVRDSASKARLPELVIPRPEPVAATSGTEVSAN